MNIPLKTTLEQPDYAWMILAGGQGRRMGFQDKGWLEYQGETLIEALIGQLSAQTPSLPIVINANQTIPRYQRFGFEVVKDLQTDFQGPLSGVLSVMQSARVQPKIAWLTWPVDAPFSVDGYFEKMTACASSEKKEVAVAKQVGLNKDQLQYTHLMIKPHLEPSLKAYLNEGGRSIKGWLTTLDLESIQSIAFKEGALSQWINLNQPEDFLI